MRKIRTLAAAGVAAATVMLGVVAASPASAAQNCTSWNDSATYGISCSQYDGYNSVRAVALCTDGNVVAGAWVWVGSGATSYAYCSSSNNSGYVSGTVQGGNR
ncbi:hypothetical protein ACI1MP_15330 [Kitasatospora griseola]|uniref:hypothetical protein n=1 Tax=Kitasatospora griseola TaxID=2064 RepID=UPI003855BD2D